VTRRPAPLPQAEIAVAAQQPRPVGDPRYIGRFDVTNWLADEHNHNHAAMARQIEIWPTRKLRAYDRNAGRTRPSR